MSKKQKQVISKILLKKSPKDEALDLSFSITRKISRDGCGKNPLRMNYSQKKKQLSEDEQSSERRKKFWDAVDEVDGRVNEIGEKVLEQVAHNLTVHKREHKKSPYIVRLLSEFEAPATSPLQSKEPLAQETDAAWIKEVERLRKSARDAYRSGARRIYIDLLGKKRSKQRLRNLKKAALKPKNFPDALAGFAVLATTAAGRWIFEFILSIPLGFLLALGALLKAVEVLNRWAMRGSKTVGKGMSCAVEQVMLMIWAIVKGFVVIPIKFATILFLIIYRLISCAGSSALWLGRSGCEGIKNYFSVFSHPPRKFCRKLIAVCVISGAVILPVKFLIQAPSSIRFIEGRVLGATKEGYTAMSDISGSLGQGQVDAASEQLEFARKKFTEARANIESLNIFMRGIVSILPQGQDGIHAISAGEELALSGSLIAEAVGPFIGEIPLGLSAKGIVTNIQKSLESALPHIQSASSHLSSINPENLPEEYREKFIKARGLIGPVEAAIVDFNSFSGTLLEILGSDRAKRYAVLFQNNNELRPAGGFIGSLAFIDVKDGRIENIDIPSGGSYDFQGYLSEHIMSPKPLWLVNPRWELQDANWYPDWPKSAEKVAWFIEHAGHSSIDGVIAMQATTLVKLMEIIGSIEFSEYNVVLNSGNVIEEIQKEVELNYDKAENQPKKYIAQLVPRVLERILSSSGRELGDILSLVKSEIIEKNILLYFRDPMVNQKFIDRGWEPEILDSDLDYLSVIHANIGGGKTDGVIEQAYDQEISISDDGTVLAELSIIRRHNGDASHPFESFNNVDYVRVYAPEGSELISFDGVKPPAAAMFKQPEDYYKQDYELSEIEGNVLIDEKTGTRITREFGKTVFGNWLQVDPGNILFAKVKYKLPFKVKPFDIFNPDAKSAYSLILQKQAGARSVPYSVSLRYPPEWKVLWQKSATEGSIKVLGPGLSVFEGELSQDTGFAVLFVE